MEFSESLGRVELVPIFGFVDVFSSCRVLHALRCSALQALAENRKTTLATGFHITSSDTETATFDNIESSAREN